MGVVTAVAHAEFSDLVVPHLDHVYGVALRISGDPTEAEDVVQDALLRAYRGLGGLRDRERVRFWLTKVVYSAWRDRHRRDADRDRELSIDDERFSLFDRLVEEDPLPYSDRLHLDFLELFDDERLCDALAALPPAYRTALVLAYVYGFKAREIAELTSTPLNTVLARLSRGRRQLERGLWEYATERGLLRKGAHP